MYLRLYDNTSMKLELFPTFNKRVEYINENLFNNVLHETYYNICSRNFKNKNQIENIENRWLGIKVVNKPNKDEKLKATLNYIAGYLLGEKEYPINIKIRRYLELSRLSDPTQNELVELNSLKNNVLYCKSQKFRDNRKDFIIMINSHMENLLMHNLNKLEQIENREYTEQFMYDYTIDRLNVCNDIKYKISSTVDTLHTNIIKKENLFREIQSEYKNIQNSDDTIKYISNIVKDIKKIDSDNIYLEKQIEYLNDEYLMATELIYNNN